jgi:hypothetical protein
MSKGICKMRGGCRKVLRRPSDEKNNLGIYKRGEMRYSNSIIFAVFHLKQAKRNGRSKKHIGKITTMASVNLIYQGYRRLFDVWKML